MLGFIMHRLEAGARESSGLVLTSAAIDAISSYCPCSLPDQVVPKACEAA
jgi:hypothetical protein